MSAFMYTMDGESVYPNIPDLEGDAALTPSSIFVAFAIVTKTSSSGTPGSLESCCRQSSMCNVHPTGGVLRNHETLNKVSTFPFLKEVEGPHFAVAM